MLQCGSPNVAIPLRFVVLFDLRWMQRTVGFKTNVKKMSLTGYKGSVVSLPENSQLLLLSGWWNLPNNLLSTRRSTFPLHHLQTETGEHTQHEHILWHVLRCINDNKWDTQGWPSGAAGLCRVLLLRHTGCSSVWLSLLWWDWWELRGTAAPYLTHNKHTPL